MSRASGQGIENGGRRKFLRVGVDTWKLPQFLCYRPTSVEGKCVLRFGLSQCHLQATALNAVSAPTPLFLDTFTDYRRTDTARNLHFPGFDEDAAALSVNGRGHTGLEPRVDRSFATSKLLLAHTRIVLENVANLPRLPREGVFLALGLLRLAVCADNL